MNGYSLTSDLSPLTTHTRAVRFEAHSPLVEKNPIFLHAHAAWHFYHGRPAEGKWFAESARSIYHPGGVQLYRQPLVDLGWIR